MQSKPVLVSYLSGDMLHSDFCMSLGMMLLYSAVKASLWVGVNNTRCSVIDHGRNVAVEQLFASDSSHILFLDSDMVFPATTLERLLRHELDIVGATYCMRRPQHAATHRNLDRSSALPFDGSELYEVESLGGGCILIRKEVFLALKAPYFESVWISEKIPQGEDRTFCLRAREAGFKVWCDLALSDSVGHIGQKIYRLSDIECELTGREPV
jgi:hypothetical protein